MLVSYHCVHRVQSLLSVLQLSLTDKIDVWRKLMCGENECFFYSFQGSIKNTIMFLLFLLSHSNDKTML